MRLLIMACSFFIIFIFILLLTFNQFKFPKSQLPLKNDLLDVKKSIVFANWASTESATKDTIDTVLKDFEKQHPDLKLINLPIPYDQYEQELIVLSMDGQAPDIIQLDGNLPSILSSMGILEPIEPFAVHDGYLEDIYGESMKNAGKYGDHLYSVPFALTPPGFWYNKKLMKAAGLDPTQPPKTIEELEGHLKKIKLSTPDVFGFGIDTTRISYSFFENLQIYQSFGAKDLLRDPTHPSFDSPAVIHALSWIQDVVKNGYTPIDKQIKVEREMMAFNKIVYKLDGPYFEGIIRNINPNLSKEKFDETFGVTSIPSLSGLSSTTTANIHMLGLAKQAKDKEIAWELIKFLTTSDSSIKNYIIPLGMIPSQKSSQIKYAKELNRPFFKTFINEIIPSAVVMPSGPEMSYASQYMISGVQEVIAGKNPSNIAKSVNKALIELYHDQ